jgi:hypothetical protein
MTEKEYLNWKAVTESSRFRWVEDEIFRLNGRGAFYYSGGEDGVYMKIQKDGLLEAGRYEGAVPHIGEAMFMPQIEKQYADFNAAYTAALEAGGKQFLLDMLTTSAVELLSEDSAAGTFSQREHIDWDQVYISHDFQCDQTEGWPTMLCWDMAGHTAWLDLNYSLVEENQDMSQYEKLCRDFGMQDCLDWDEFNSILEELGEDAVRNAYVASEDEDEEMGGMNLL